jgi:hypothetical protein
MNIHITFYRQRGSKDISDIPPRRPYFANDLAMRNTTDVTGHKPMAI